MPEWAGSVPAGAPAAPEDHSVDVSVLVPVLNEEAQLSRAVSAMLDQHFPGRIEFLFADGGSSDRSELILAGFAARDERVLLLRNPARSTPCALNIALRQARGTYVARMDAHTEYPKDYLARGVERLERGDVISVSGPQLAAGDGRWSRRVALALNTSIGTGAATFRRRAVEEHEVVSGFTGLWRRDVLLGHGGWDEDWLNDQDTELAARLRAAGGRIVCVPEMAAAYMPRDDLRALARQYWRYGAYRVKTTHRHPTTLRRSQLLPPLLVLTGVIASVPGSAVPRLARVGLLGYGGVLAATSLGAARRGAGPDAVALPAAYLVMHLAYGAGFLAACVRTGPPLGAILRVMADSARLRGP